MDSRRSEDSRLQLARVGRRDRLRVDRAAADVAADPPRAADRHTGMGEGHCQRRVCRDVSAPRGAADRRMAVERGVRFPRRVSRPDPAASPGFRGPVRWRSSCRKCTRRSRSRLRCCSRCTSPACCTITSSAATPCSAGCCRPPRRDQAVVHEAALVEPLEHQAAVERIDQLPCSRPACPRPPAPVALRSAARSPEDPAG